MPRLPTRPLSPSADELSRIRHELASVVAALKTVEGTGSTEELESVTRDLLPLALQKLYRVLDWFDIRCQGLDREAL